MTVGMEAMKDKNLRGRGVEVLIPPLWELMVEVDLPAVFGEPGRVPGPLFPMGRHAAVGLWWAT
jgi:hypothetical protein